MDKDFLALHVFRDTQLYFKATVKCKSVYPSLSQAKAECPGASLAQRGHVCAWQANVA
jgi:hypothetical protein